MLLTGVARLGPKQAESVFLRAAVNKEFEPDPETGFEGGWFKGQVVRVDRGLTDPDSGEVHALLFLLKVSWRERARSSPGGPAARGWVAAAMWAAAARRHHRHHRP